MNRWKTLAAAALLVLATAANSQAIVREAPKDVKPGIIEVSAFPPLIKVDGKDDRFTPGVRIRNINNMLVLTGQVANQKLYTVYRRDVTGQVHEVWLLTQEEYRKVGGEDAGNPQGYKRFAELLDIIWAARAAGWFR